MGEQKIEAEAAWGHRARDEQRLPATIAIIAAIVLYIALPEKLIYGPRWLLPVLELALVLPLQLSSPRRRLTEAGWRRTFAIAIIALINLANLASLFLLVYHLVNGYKPSGLQLILSAVLIWLTNVIVFALWYWELDRGGPAARCVPGHREPDFLFPQMMTPHAAPGKWTPSFIDYLYVSFTNASAFSPTDTMPLTEWAKMLMMVQAIASLVTLALVAARAVNILA